MPNDWKNFVPHRPLPAGDPLYVKRPEGSGDELAALVKHGFNLIAVAGPMGSGKSTELSAAAAKLRSWAMACEVQLDQHLDMRNVDVDSVYELIARLLSNMLGQTRPRAEIASSQGALSMVSPLVHAPTPIHQRFVAALREVRRLGSLVLLVDGLEKSTEEMARRIVNALLDVVEEGSLIVVVPPSLVNGPTSYDLLNRAKVFPLGAVTKTQEPWTPEMVQREQNRLFFLFNVADRRLGGLDPLGELFNVVTSAIELSGGIVRVFLQLLRDAKRYASLVERETPTKDDLFEAAKDQSEHLERLLGPGDIAALRAADGTNGAEIQPIERRLRFLVHGLLLEYRIDGRTVVHPAPLLNDVLARKDAA
ncbi:MAG: ATP-binding protein [Byssovorax sp.]